MIKMSRLTEEGVVELRKRYNEAVAAGKALNVSGLKADGTGVVKVALPKTDKGKFKHIAGLDIISDNPGTYKVAAEALGQAAMGRKFREMFPGAVHTPRQPRTPAKEKAQPKSFAEKLHDAVEKAAGGDKLVDVSGLYTLKNGQLGGFRTVARFNKDGKDMFGEKYSGKKVMVAGLPIISNNTASYREAVDALDRADLAREFARAYGESYDHRSEKGAKSPAKRSGSKSPARSPKAKLSAAEKLFQQYSKAVETEGKLDVSGLKADGTGSRVIHPKSDREITKVGVPGIVVVSNNHATFAEAMALLDEVYAAGGEQSEFYEFANMYFAEHQEGPPKRGTGSPKAKTPKGRKPRAASISKVASASSASSGSQGRARSLSRSPARSGSAGSVAERLARAVAQERSASRSPVRAASRSPARSPVRSTSRSPARSGSRSGSADLLPVPRGGFNI
jgi:hypothetical protein